MSETRATTIRSTERSQALFATAQEHLAGGVGSGTRSPRSGWKPSPIFVDHASGSRVTDVDGNEYIDYQMGQGPLILGHRPPTVLEAVTRTINERGSLFALAHDLEAQAADAVSARMPSMETLRFGNSGSECVAYALRFARAATGRTLVLRFEGCYHGWTDGIHWSAHPSLDEAGPAGAPAVVPATTGIPPQIGETLLGRTVQRRRDARAHLRGARRRDRGGDHRADHGQRRRRVPRPRIPRAPARADDPPRLGARVRRGADRHARRARRRAGPARRRRPT